MSLLLLLQHCCSWSQCAIAFSVSLPVEIAVITPHQCLGSCGGDDPRSPDSTGPGATLPSTNLPTFYQRPRFNALSAFHPTEVAVETGFIGLACFIWLF